jgi:hypothetical protein
MPLWDIFKTRKKSAPAEDDADADAAMRAFDATRNYKVEMSSRRAAQFDPSGPGAKLIPGAVGDNAASAALIRRTLDSLSKSHVQPFTSHHVLNAYLRRLADGGGADPAFEAKLLHEDLQITLVQVAASLYEYARHRRLDTNGVFRQLLPSGPGIDDAIASHFMKIMCASEVGRLREPYYLSILFQGYLSEPDDTDFLFVGLSPGADNVAFVTTICRTLR